MSLSYRRALKFLGIDIGSAWVLGPGAGRRQRARGGAGFEYLEPRELFSNTPPIVTNFTKPEALHATSENMTFADFNLKFNDADPGDTLQTIEIVSLPANGTLTLNGNAVIAGQNITVVNSDIGLLTYTQTGNFTGTDSFVWNGSDGTAFAAATANATITIPTDSPPVLGNISGNVAENVTKTFALQDFMVGFSDANAGDTLRSITITGLPTHGTLALSGVTLTGTQTITAANIPNLTYTPTADFTSTDSFTWNASDGFLPAATDVTANLTVTNTAPVISDVVVRVYGTPETFALSDFSSKFADSNGDPLAAIKITALPVTVASNGTVSATGNLTLNGVAVNVGDVIQAADIPSLVFTPSAGFGGNATFTWQGSDGTTFSATGNATVTDVAVTAFPLGVVENRTKALTLALFQSGFQDGAGGSSLQTIQIVTLPSPADGVLQFNGVDVTAGQTFTAAQANDLTYVPVTGVSAVDLSSMTWNGSDGISFAPAAAQVFIGIGNQVPVVTSSNMPVFVTVTTNFTAAEFLSQFSDPDDLSPNPSTTDSLEQIQITKIPTQGTLQLNGVNVFNGETIDVTDLGNLTYTPLTPNSTTPDSFQWLASDGKDFTPSTGAATFTLTPTLPTVTSVFLPGFPNQTLTLPADEFTSSSAFADANPNGTLESIKIVQLPTQGTLKDGNTTITLNQVIPLSDLGNITYTPNAGFIGSDSLQWQASDLGGFSANPGTLTLQIDTRPNVGNVTKSETVKGTSVTFLPTDFSSQFTDPDATIGGNSTTGKLMTAITIVTLPTDGTLTFAGAVVTAGETIQATQIQQLTFTQTTGFTGNATFTWQASDGILSSTNGGTVTINVPNTPPTVTTVNFTTPENITGNFTLAQFTASFADPDTSNVLTSVTIVTLPSPAAGTLMRTDPTNFANTIPVQAGDVLAAIPPTDPSDPTTGMTLEQVLDSLQFKPTSGFQGTGSFTWNASDGHGGIATNAATVKITITPPSFTQVEVLHATSSPIALTQFTGIAGNTTDSIQITKLPTNGKLTITNNGTTTTVALNQTLSLTDLATLTYTQQPGFSGTDSFTWSAFDAADVLLVTAAKGIFTIPVDTAPSLTNFSATVSESATLAAGHPFILTDFTSHFTDPDSVTTGNVTTNDSVASIQITSLPKHGKLMFGGSAVTLNQTIQRADIGGLTFVPTVGYVGTDTFGWNASDGTLQALNPATVTMTVAPTTLGNVSLTTTPGVAINFGSNTFSNQFHNADTDAFPSGNSTVSNALSSIKITSLPSHGKLMLSGQPVTSNQIIAAGDIANLTYTPTANFHGTDTFTWQASDTFSGGTQFSAKANVNILNDNAPTLASVTKAVTENTAKAFTLADFTANFSDANNDKLQSIQIVTLPANGTLTINNTLVVAGQIVKAGDISKLIYTPTPGQVGPDTFTWNASDGFQQAALLSGNVTPGIVTLNVNTPPTLSTINKVVPPGALPLTFSATDFTSSFTDGDGDALAKIKFTKLPSHGTLKLNGVKVKQNQEIVLADLGNLTYTASGNFVGNDTFQWNASDGSDYSAQSASIVLALPPVFAVYGNGTPILNKSTSPSLLTLTDFGSWTTLADSSMLPDMRTYTIQNFGNVTITLPTITLSNSVDFTVTQPLVTSLAPNASTTFTVQFNPTTVGKRTTIVTMPANPIGGTPAFTFELQGNSVHTTLAATPNTTGDATTGVVQFSSSGGSGVGASNGQLLGIIYTGYLTDGTIFDSSSLHGGAQFLLRLDDTPQHTYLSSDQTGGYAGVDGGVIEGWEFGLQGIKVGEKRTFVINSDAGYGPNGNQDGTIAGNETLIFDVQCVSLSSAPQVGVISLNSTGNGTAYLFAGQKSISANDNTLFKIPAGDSSVTQSFALVTSTTIDSSGAPLSDWTFRGRAVGPTGDTKDFTVALNGRTLIVTFHPSSAGVKNATIHILTNDPLHPDFEFNVQGVSGAYTDMIAEYNTLKFPTTAFTSGTNKTVSLPIVLKNIGNVSMPANSKTNVQIYAKNVSTGTLTLIKLINNVDVSNLGAFGLKFMTTTVTLPASLVSGSYLFVTEVNLNVTEGNTVADPTLAIAAETASFNNKATTISGISVVQGAFHVSGILSSSTLATSANAVTGNLTISLKNTGSISLPLGQQATVQIIARPVGATDSSTDVILESGAALGLISLSQLSSGSKSFTVPVNFGLTLASGQYNIIVLVTPVQPLTGVSLVTLDADSKGNPLVLTSANA